MIPAPQYRRTSTLFVCDRIGPVPAHIVKSSDLFILPENNDEGVTGNFKCSIVARVPKLGRVGDEEPSLNRVVRVAQMYELSDRVLTLLKIARRSS